LAHVGPWAAWLYIYGVGAVVFVTTLTIAVRAGAVRWRHRPDRILLCALTAGLLGFMAVHAAWIVLAT
jgi:hypothetical protein